MKHGYSILMTACSKMKKNQVNQSKKSLILCRFQVKVTTWDYHNRLVETVTCLIFPMLLMITEMLVLAWMNSKSQINLSKLMSNLKENAYSSLKMPLLYLLIHISNKNFQPLIQMSSFKIKHQVQQWLQSILSQANSGQFSLSHQIWDCLPPRL